MPSDAVPRWIEGVESRASRGGAADHFMPNIQLRPELLP